MYYALRPNIYEHFLPFATTFLLFLAESWTEVNEVRICGAQHRTRLFNRRRKSRGFAYFGSFCHNSPKGRPFEKPSTCLSSGARALSRVVSSYGDIKMFEIENMRSIGRIVRREPLKKRRMLTISLI